MFKFQNYEGQPESTVTTHIKNRKMHVFNEIDTTYTEISGYFSA